MLGGLAPLPDLSELDAPPWSEERLRAALDASVSEFHGHRLRRRVAVWQSLRPRVPARVLQWITLGYWLPFVNGVPPPPFHVPNTQSADEDPAFVDSAVEELVRKGRARCIGRLADVLATGTYWISALLVAVASSGKKRLCLACTRVNEFLEQRCFRYETLQSRRHHFRRGCYFAWLDLTAGYHHLALYEPHRQYISFAWRGMVYVATVAYFGIASVCEAFSALLRPWVRRWRVDLRICMGQYLDDSGVVAASQALAAWAARRIGTDLILAGFVVNFEKSCLEGAQLAVHLGMGLDFVAGEFYIPGPRLARMRALVSVLVGGQASALQIACFMGLLWASVLAVGPGIHGYCYFLQRDVQSFIPPGTARGSLLWAQRFAMSAAAVAEARWWHDFLAVEPRGPFQRAISWQRVRIVTTDASAESGAGGTLQRPDGSVLPAVADYPDRDAWAATSSTFRELWGFLAVLSALADQVRGQRLAVVFDNAACVHILQGSHTRREQLHVLRAAIWERIRALDCDMWPIWVPRDQNAIADTLSKFRDPFDLQLHPLIFAALAAALLRLGVVLSVDRFAARWNAQLPAFWSWFAQPGAAGVDAMRAPWTDGAHGFSWVFPPFSLLRPVWEKLRAERWPSVVLFPHWEWAVWWPELFEERDGALYWRWPIVTVFRLRLHGWGHPVFLDRSRNRARPVPWAPVAELLIAIFNPAAPVEAAPAVVRFDRLPLFP